jgi:3-oxoacyl-[acyl-carrier protein] reductase
VGAERRCCTHRISSISALGDQDRVNYAPAKPELEGLTRADARELWPYGVTVNAVGPGIIHTAMTTRSAQRAGRALEVQAGSIFVGRVGTVYDLAERWRSSLMTADFATGQVLYVTGGSHE